jgi:hypothetical protein
MIVNEDAESVDVLKVAGFFIVAIFDAFHRLVGAEDIADRVEHRVVEESCKGALVRTNVGGITIEALTHLENASELPVFSPEILRYLRDSVNADAIKAIRVNDALDPVLEILANIAVALVEVRETSKSTVLHGRPIIPVDIAIAVVVLRFIQWVDSAEVVANRAYMICNNVHHDPHVLIVSGLHKIFQVIGGTKVGVCFLPVCGPVAMVATVNVVNDR